MSYFFFVFESSSSSVVWFSRNGGIFRVYLSIYSWLVQLWCIWSQVRVRNMIIWKEGIMNTTFFPDFSILFPCDSPFFIAFLEFALLCSASSHFYALLHYYSQNQSFWVSEWCNFSTVSTFLSFAIYSIEFIALFS